MGMDVMYSKLCEVAFSIFLAFWGLKYFLWFDEWLLTWFYLDSSHTRPYDAGQIAYKFVEEFGQSEAFKEDLKF